MFELISFRNGLVEIRKNLKSANPRGKKYFEYLLDADSLEQARELTAEANRIGGAAFAEKYNINVNLIE